MDMIREFKNYLIGKEKSAATIEKYVRDTKAFFIWLGGRELKKAEVIEYKQHILARYRITSVNSMLSSLNSYFESRDMPELKVKTIKQQRRIFADKEKELTKDEYERLLTAAEKSGNDRLYYIMQTICSTGMRVSELRFITVEAVCRAYAEVINKGKGRRVILPRGLCRVLRGYSKKRGIRSGMIFAERDGRAVSRLKIWREMKRLCALAGVGAEKVFPHNLRHLFAVTFYSAEKDIVRLADLLGHASINTTRIYTVESGDTHRRLVDSLDLVRKKALAT